jgi:hypothetical protein
MNASRRREDSVDATRHRSTKRTVVNWMLAVSTLLGAVAVVLFAYAQVLGTDACSDVPCPRLGPGKVGFTVIVYGTPIVAVATVAASFWTARLRLGIVLPVLTWALLIVAAVVLKLTFPM